jgi:hypothetical protein
VPPGEQPPPLTGGQHRCCSPLDSTGLSMVCLASFIVETCARSWPVAEDACPGWEGCCRSRTCLLPR